VRPGPVSWSVRGASTGRNGPNKARKSKKFFAGEKVAVAPRMGTSCAVRGCPRRAERRQTWPEGKGKAGPDSTRSQTCGKGTQSQAGPA
jgi:hypothetical protein